MIHGSCTAGLNQIYFFHLDSFNKPDKLVFSYCTFEKKYISILEIRIILNCVVNRKYYYGKSLET